MPAIAAVSGDAVYTATYASTPRVCRITWQNPDGSVLGVTAAPYGAVPTHAPPLIFRCAAAWTPETSAGPRIVSVPVTYSMV